MPLPSLPDGTRPLWDADAPSTAYPPLRDDLSVHTAVIGGGITGLTAALRLAEEGRRIAVLEMHQVGGGETGHTTAHLTEVVDNGYATIAADFGRDGAALVARSSREAIDFIERTVDALAISCRFERVPGYLYAERADHVERVRDEIDHARRAGVDAVFTRDVPLPFRTLGAMRVERQAQFHPRAYLAGLARRIAAAGGLIFEETRVEAVHDGEPCRVETLHARVTAQAVIAATNVPINRVALITKLPAYRSYAIAARVRGDAPRGLFWDTEDPYHYTRSHATDAGTVVIIGGEDHKTGSERDTRARYAALADYAAARFAVERIEHQWSGQIIEPVDGLPYIGLNTASSRVYVATGFAGNGLTYGTAAGLMLADLILGRDTPYASLYDARRVKPLAAARDYVAENVAYPAHLLKDRVAALDVEAEDLEAVPAGTGRIVRIDGRKRAVYRDGSGTVHAYSPVCPHMGCDVAWNAAEATWDCPCHGSRFTATGQVLNGPATHPLSPVEVPQRSGVGR